MNEKLASLYYASQIARRDMGWILFLVLFGISGWAHAQENIDGKLITAALCPDGRQTHRFEKPITLSVVGNAADVRPVIDQQIKEFNAILAGLPIQITAIGDNDEGADIVFRVVDDKMYDSKVKSNWDSSGKLTKADITLKRYEPVSKYTQSTFRSLVLISFLKALGFGERDPSVRADSFWSTGGSALTDLDRKIIRFFYESVPPKTEKSKVRILAQKGLAQTIVPPISAQSQTAVPEATATDQQSKIENFVVAALTNNGRSSFRKWVRSPSYSCLGETAPFQPIIQKFCADVDAVLTGLPVQPTAAVADNPQADVTAIMRRLVWADATKTSVRGSTSFPPHYMKNEEIPYNDRWNQSLAATKLPLKRWQIEVIGNPNNPTKPEDPNGRDPHAHIVRELYQGGLASLGIWWVASKDVESILAPGERKEFTDFDRRLIRFAYEFVPLGASKETIRRLFKEHWNSIPIQDALAQDEARR